MSLDAPAEEEHNLFDDVDHATYNRPMKHSLFKRLIEAGDIDTIKEFDDDEEYEKKFHRAEDGSFNVSLVRSSRGPHSPRRKRVTPIKHQLSTSPLPSQSDNSEDNETLLNQNEWQMIETALRKAFESGMDPLAYHAPDYVFRCTNLPRTFGFVGDCFRKNMLDTMNKNWYYRLFDGAIDKDGWNSHGRPVEDKSYDYFISYRWSCGQFSLYTCMVYAFNMAPTFWSILLFAPCFAFCLMLIPDPCDTFLATACQQDPSGIDHGGVFWVIPVFGFILMLISLLFFSQIWRWRSRVFFDRKVINQYVPEFAGEGVGAIPTILMDTECLVCFYDNQYLTRLWCVYELALFVKLSRNPKLKFVNVHAAHMYFVMILFFALLFLFFPNNVLWFGHFNDWKRNPSSNPNTAFGFAAVIVKQTMFYFFGSFWLESLDRLDYFGKNFDVRNCHCCHEETEKPLLLISIGRIFNPRLFEYLQRTDGEGVQIDADEMVSMVREGLDNFNHYVRDLVTEKIAFSNWRKLASWWPYKPIMMVIFVMWLHTLESGWFFYPWWSENYFYHNLTRNPYIMDHPQLNFISMLIIAVVYMPFFFHVMVFVFYGMLIRAFYFLRTKFQGKFAYYWIGVLYVIVGMHMQSFVFEPLFHLTFSLCSGAKVGVHAPFYKFVIAPPYLWQEGTGIVVNVDTGSLAWNLFIGWFLVALSVVFILVVFQPQWLTTLFRKVKIQ